MILCIPPHIDEIVVVPVLGVTALARRVHHQPATKIAHVDDPAIGCQVIYVERLLFVAPQL